LESREELIVGCRYGLRLRLKSIDIDLETRDHLVEILRECPTAMIIISHDENFLDEIEAAKWKIK
jgi:hypothetical protein